MKLFLGIAGILVGLGVVVLGGAYWYFMSFEPDRTVYPILGIDISHHQGNIDWDQLSKDDVRFVYMKATEGGDWKDRRFAINWREAARVGLLRGAYHFFTFCRSGSEQAQNFIDTVALAPNSLPPAVDLEFGGNCRKQPTLKEILHELGVFLKRLEKKYRKKPVLYVTREFYEAYMVGQFRDYPLWVRSIIFEPHYVQRKWHLWQFHNRARKVGIDGPVDLNVFNGDQQDFAKFVRRGK